MGNPIRRLQSLQGLAVCRLSSLSYRSRDTKPVNCREIRYPNQPRAEHDPKTDLTHV
jgi:hypothetical protein